MTEKRGIQKTLDAMHIVLLIGIVVLMGLTIYNYSQSGRFNFTSLLVCLVLLALIAFQRVGMMKRGKG